MPARINSQGATSPNLRSNFGYLAGSSGGTAMGSSDSPGLTNHALKPQRHPAFVDMIRAPLAQVRIHSSQTPNIKEHDLNAQRHVR